MAIERAHEHPTFDSMGNAVTSLAAPTRGATELGLFRTEVPPGGGLPAHRHDHLDVFVIDRGSCTFHLGAEAFELGPGDSGVVPIGTWHRLEAGPDGVVLTVTMLAGTRLEFEDGRALVPPWLAP
ncbi:MAG TPA: cupin domain-containing protein [Actinomycetota bacterium]|nr:cupin domain-containing protein [Actinomycetota bacterium]